MLKPIDILMSAFFMLASSILVYGYLYHRDAETVYIVTVSGIGGFLYAYSLQWLRSKETKAKL